MGWERSRYYTRSRKIDGHVVREYMGRGLVAEIAAMEDADARLLKQRQREEDRQARQRFRDNEAPLREWQQLADLAMKRALAGVGLYQHHRGEWRRGMAETNDPLEGVNLDLIPRTGEGIQALIDRAKRGDETALPAIRECLKVGGPGGFAFVELVGGNLATLAERKFIGTMAGDNLALQLGIQRKLELLRFDLAGPNPSALEKLLAERIVACWLQVQEADHRYLDSDKDSIKWGEYHQRRQDRAHQRYLAALRTLAQVRKLEVPALQVNIGKNQVNVAGDNNHVPARQVHHRGKQRKPTPRNQEV